MTYWLSDGGMYHEGQANELAAGLKDYEWPDESVDREVKDLWNRYYGPKGYYGQPHQLDDVVTADLIIRGIVTNRRVAEKLLVLHQTEGN